MKKVLVVSSINGIAGRNGLTGIFDFVNEGHDWSIRFLQNPGDSADGMLPAALRGGVDGVIVSPRAMTPGIRRLLDRPVPVVMVHNPGGGVPRHGPRFSRAGRAVANATGTARIARSRPHARRKTSRIPP